MFVLKKELWVGKKIGSRGGGGTKIPNHKASKKNDISKQHSKQAIRQGKLRKIKNVC